MAKSTEEIQRRIEKAERVSKRQLYHNNMQVFKIFPRFA